MGKRYLKVPISSCKDMNDIDVHEKKVYVGFYTKEIDSREILIDIIQTVNNSFYVKLTDVTDGRYDELDFNEFVKSHAEPTLFNYFDV